jgi:hypothetical protein
MVPKMNKKTSISIILLATIAVALTCITYGALTVSKDLSTSGTITVTPNLGVYSDSDCQTPISTIDWGTIAPGGTATQTIYIKNTGAGVSLSLSMTPSEWTPEEADGPIALDWTPQSTTLAPGESTSAVLTLSVSQSIDGITSFSVQISIVGAHP